MAAALIPPITVEQFLNFEAPEGYRAELIRGEIILSPDSKPLHHDVVDNILEALKKAIGKEFKVGSRCNMNLKELFSMPSPDVFVVSHDLWRAARDGGLYPRGAPLLAVEVLSPSNRPMNVESKTKIYIEAGSLAVWNVDLRNWNLTVHTKHGATPSLSSHDKIHLSSPFPAVEFNISDFFRLS